MNRAIILVDHGSKAPAANAMLDEVAAQYPNVNWHCSGPIGLELMLADLILRRTDNLPGERLHVRGLSGQTLPIVENRWPTGSK